MAPPGMVFVPAGTIIDKDVVMPMDSGMNSDTAKKTVTLSAFFMDQTEVTNKQYRTFVDWVADSVAITDYLKDEKYFLKVKALKSKAAPNFVADSTKRIDWTKVDGSTPLWKSKDPAIQSKLMNKLYTMVNGQPMLVSDLAKYSFTHLTADPGGKSKYITEYVAVLPDLKVWSKDFPNAQMEVMDNNYYTNRGYNEYPVVGVSWKQARAYTDWRSKTIHRLIGPNSLINTLNLQFSLPTEAQWKYAASKEVKPEDMDKLASVEVKEKKKKVSKAAVNFKQQEGDYGQDGGTFTLPVKSYAPNSVGVYNLLGNVSEWTLDAFSPSYQELVHDLNPVLLYDAKDTDSEVMRRKVVRGGSWKDNAALLTPSTRNYELQEVGHSYIGFRCVMAAPDIILEQSKTRKLASNK
ncbi:SUMF1/EgtB/PvdO family nonheme iron enzyme [Mucilaginibacter sp. Bleaf8]|uniref:type IX secretion system lipoprotein PorK/GldK n=1 Tax=Mucilaginibacter sp. Bleaf8 TaxID=2834430 RepID=UPI001BCC0FE0|nr:SUMF1/EgtB/PvdO family nonheme iron enzyme [Mucilaginibacter sp. Bleaf8]MBS7567028.1 SUMF1/EgtB/PvdO family nonheme iron enzyme [Mucilaginibacter sp. Bleaf8]